MHRQNIAVILAAGQGSRMGLELPKQFIKIAGKTILEHTVDVFQANHRVDEIAIVAQPVYVKVIEDMIISNEWTKVKKLLHGGRERYDSTLSAIHAYAGNVNVNLIIHDSVRPLVNHRMINDVVNALKQYDAVNTAINTADTIIQVDGGGEHIDHVPEREYLRRGQTPQGFKLETLQQAYELALRDPQFRATDDCGVVKRYLPNTSVYVVLGEESNMKVTHIEDIHLLEKLFQIRTVSGPGEISLDALDGKVAVVFGGSSGIGRSTVSIINENGGVAYALSRSTNGIDIRERHLVEQALAEIHDKHGRIDYVVCSAALLVKEPLSHMSEQSIAAVIDVNLKGMINVSSVAKQYLQRSRGQLLHFTSSSYTRGRAHYSVYSATKAGVVNFVQAIAEEWEPFNIRVNCINPERTRTPMRVANFGYEPEGTLLEARTVAEVAVKTLLSDINGTVVDVKLPAIADRVLEIG